MDYEKKYNEALKRAKEYKNHGYMMINVAIDNIFPELKESEDERIRKHLISLVKNWDKDGIVSKYTSNSKEIKQILAWLEKQGEKPTDKVEPKFNVGAWITFNGGIPFKILKIEEELSGILDYLLIRQDGHKSYFNKKYVDENARLWTIQDAKDGDVLTVDGISFIYCFNGDYQGNYCCIDSDGVFRTSLDFGFNGKTILPATKEQRELLFKEMKEAGYEWDVKKKRFI